MSNTPLTKDREVDARGNCSKCGGTHYGTGWYCPMPPEYFDTNSPPVMNPPADEAEAGNRVHGAPGQADRDAPSRGVSGLTSRPEARPVTTTEHLTSNPLLQRLRDVGTARGVEMYSALAYQAADEIENLGLELRHCTNGNEFKDARIEGLKAVCDHLRAALERIDKLAPRGPDLIGPLHGAGLAAGFKIAGDIAREALAGSVKQGAPGLTQAPLPTAGLTQDETTASLPCWCPYCGEPHSVTKKPEAEV